MTLKELRDEISWLVDAVTSIRADLIHEER